MNLESHCGECFLVLLLCCAWQRLMGRRLMVLIESMLLILSVAVSLSSNDDLRDAGQEPGLMASLTVSTPF